MRWKPFPIVGGSYADQSRAWSVQDTVNMLPVASEAQGTRSPSILRCAPGLSAFSDLGTNAPIRGMHNVEGLLLAVSGQTLYKIAYDGNPTAIGTIPGAGRVSMAHNQVAGGNQVAIANGQSGYVYNTVDGSLVQITDPSFVGAISFDYLDSYITGIDPSKSFAFTSALADATSYNTLDREQAEGSPDKLVGQLVTHREWWLFGERTIEPYVDTGAATGTFQRAGGTVIEIGLAGTFAAANMDNTVYWLGNDGIVYVAQGYSPVRISTHAIEADIAQRDMSEAFAMVYKDRGHTVFYLTFPDGHTWGYDASAREWHRRESKGLDRWRLNTLVRWNNAWVGGDYTNGRIYQIDWNTQEEDGQQLVRSHTTGVTQDSQNAIIINGLELVINTGVPEAVPSRPLLSPLSLSGSLGNARSGIVESFAYRVYGGSKPVVVSIASGSLPAGLTMDSAGVVTGTRTTTGSYTWTVQAKDNVGNVVTLNDASTTSAVWAWTFVQGQNQTEQIGYVGLPSIDPSSDIVFCTAYSGKVMESIDGKTWNYTSGQPAVATQGLSCAATNTAWFVDVADGGNSGHMYRSKDKGATWTEIKYNGNILQLQDYVASGSCILACDYSSPYALYSTDDGDTWTQASTPTGFNPGDSLIPFRGLYVDAWQEWIIPGQGKIYSADGVVPATIVEAVSSTSHVGSVAYSPTLDMAVVSGPTDRVYTKTGKMGAWTTVTFTNTPNYVQDICWHPEIQMFIGSKGADIITSTDGVTWTQRTTNLPGIIGSKSMLYMPWTGEMLVLYENSATNNPWVSDI